MLDPLRQRPLRAASLIRVSTAHVQQADSPRHQLEYIHGEMQRQGWVDTSLVYQAELTGAIIINRPDIQRMLDDAKAGRFDAIVLKSISRLGRDVLGLLMVKRMLDDLRVELIALADGYRSFRDPELIFLVHAERAQAGRQEISKNVRTGVAQAAKRGIWPAGTLPFGLRREGRFSVVAHPDTAPICQLILKLRQRGWGYVRICTHLNQEIRVKAPGWWHIRDQIAALKEGGDADRDDRIQARLKRLEERLLTARFPWSPRTVRMICQNTAYYGELRYNRTAGRRRMHGRLVREERDPDEWVIIPCEPLITREDWAAAQSVADTRRRLPRRSLGSRFLLSGLISCGQCGCAMRGQPARSNTGRRGGDTKGYYLCRGAAESGLHPGEYVRATTLEKAVLDRLRKEVERLPLPGLSTGRPAGPRDPKQEIARLEAQLQDLAEARFYRREALRKGEIGEAEFEYAAGKISQQEDEIRQRIESLLQGRQHGREEELRRRAVSEAAAQLLRLEGPDDALKTLLPTLIRKVVVHSATQIEVHVTFTAEEVGQTTAAD